MNWSDRDQYLSSGEFNTGTSSLYFDPSTVQYVDPFPTTFPTLDVPNLDFTSDFTIEIFANSSQTGLVTPFFVQSPASANNNSFILTWISDSIVYTVFPAASGNPVLKSRSVSGGTGAWKHVAVSYVASTNTFYFAFDGVVDSYTSGFNTGMGVGDTAAITLGRYRGTDDRKMEGYLDNLRVSQEALYTTATYTVPDASNWSVTGNTLYYDDFEPPSITWVQDGNSRYEISSKDHLLQLMNRGSLFADEGTPPSNYWNADYIQTVDIDLAEDHANILPIGVRSDIENSNFFGNYDGGEFTISNWSYTDPSATMTGCSWYVGLFGAVNGCTLKNIRMNGVCTLDGYRDAAGFVCGAFNGTSPSYNIEVDLDDGSFIVGGKTGGNAGSVFGFANGQIMSGITLKGTVEMYSSDPVRGEGYHIMGGMFGQSWSCQLMENIRNLATFKNGITGTFTGGICGQLSYNSATGSCSNIMNAMMGDMVGTNAGGIFGYVFNMNGTIGVTNVVNAMTGSITGSLSSGGITGYTTNSSITYSNVMNYMCGDLSSSKSGGMFGEIVSGDTSTMNNSISAMYGTATDSVSGSGAPSSSDVTIDTNFGSTYTTNTYGTTTVLTGYLYDTTFTSLPYMDMSGTDTEGNVYEWDFVFANLGGNSSYSQYTHLSIHRGNVLSPFYADMGIVASNTTTYLTYGNVNELALFVDESFTVVDSTAEVVYDYNASTIIYGVPVPTLLLNGAVLYVNAAVSESWSGSGTSLTNLVSGGVNMTMDAQPDTIGGSLDFSDGTSHLYTAGEITGRTVSMWIYKVENDPGGLDEVVLDLRASSGSSVPDAYLYNSSTGSSGSYFTGSTDTKVYIDGVLSDIQGIYDAPILTWFNIAMVCPTDFTTTINFGRSFINDRHLKYRLRSIMVYDYAMSQEDIVNNHGALSIIPTSLIPLIPLIVDAKPIRFGITVTEVSGAVMYRLTYQESGGSEEVAATNFTNLSHTIDNLAPGTSYTLRLYSRESPNGPYSLSYTTIDTTLPNDPANYNTSDFLDNGVFDLGSLDEGTLGSLSEVMNDIFSTGDKISLRVGNKDTDTEFVKRGESANVEDSEALLLPFDSSAGSSQTIDLQLSDNATTVSVTYDESANTIGVGSTVYSPGDFFILDGKKVSVFEY